MKAIQGVLRSLLEKGAVDALLVPMTLPGGTWPRCWSAMRQRWRPEEADPLAPVLPINAARAALT
jgi:hypothetical protein